jgi:hypothetical protein
MQEFKLNKKYITLLKGCLVVFIAFLALGFALPFLPDDRQGSLREVLVTMLMCTVVFGPISVLTWLTLRKLPYADVAVDDDGIWYTYAGKDQGLIYWKQITKVKERAYLQRLDLLDCNGQKLLSVEYQLTGFEILRALINDNMSYSTSQLNQSTFSKNPLYHWFYLACVLGFSALGVYVGLEDNPLLGFGAMSVAIAFIIYEYVVTATGINLVNGNFVIAYPFTKRSVPLSEIGDILIADDFHNGNRIPEVWIISKNSKKPFKLKGFRVDSNALYKALRTAANL